MHGVIGHRIAFPTANCAVTGETDGRYRIPLAHRQTDEEKPLPRVFRQLLFQNTRSIFLFLSFTTPKSSKSHGLFMVNGLNGFRSLSIGAMRPMPRPAGLLNPPPTPWGKVTVGM